MMTVLGKTSKEGKDQNRQLSGMWPALRVPHALFSWTVRERKM